MGLKHLHVALRSILTRTLLLQLDASQIGDRAATPARPCQVSEFSRAHRRCSLRLLYARGRDGQHPLGESPNDDDDTLVPLHPINAESSSRTCAHLTPGPHLGKTPTRQSSANAPKCRPPPRWRPLMGRARRPRSGGRGPRLRLKRVRRVATGTRSPCMLLRGMDGAVASLGGTPPGNALALVLTGLLPD